MFLFASQVDGIRATYICLVRVLISFIIISMSCMLKKVFFKMCLILRWMFKVKLKVRQRQERMRKYVASVRNWRKMKQQGNILKFVIAKARRKNTVVCQWVSQLRFLEGYVSNLARCVSMCKYKLYGMKSYDCHIFMQQLILNSLSWIITIILRKVLIELSSFFRKFICSKIRMEDMNRLIEEISVILCKL